MNHTIFNITDNICTYNSCRKCPHTRGVCEPFMCAQNIYTAHVKPLEDALADAIQKNAITLGQEAAKIIAAMTGAIAGNENSVKVTLSGARCPYCGHVSTTIEEATEHDGICPKHPAVIRAIKAEADKAALEDALAKIVSHGGSLNEY